MKTWIYFFSYQTLIYIKWTSHSFYYISFRFILLPSHKVALAQLLSHGSLCRQIKAARPKKNRLGLNCRKMSHRPSRKIEPDSKKNRFIFSCSAMPIVLYYYFSRYFWFFQKGNKAYTFRKLENILSYSNIRQLK